MPVCRTIERPNARELFSGMWTKRNALSSTPVKELADTKTRGPASQAIRDSALGFGSATGHSSARCALSTVRVQAQAVQASRSAVTL